MKTDREIVREVNALAHKMLGFLGTGYVVDKEFKFYRTELTNPRLIAAWEQAVDAYESITNSEVADAVAFVLEEGEDEPPQDTKLVKDLKFFLLTSELAQDDTDYILIQSAIEQIQELERIQREAAAYDRDEISAPGGNEDAARVADGDDYDALLAIIGTKA